MALYPNLPGFEVEVQDGGLGISRPLVGPKVTLLGTTTNTTYDVNDPKRLERRADALNFDNADGTVSELTKAIDEVYGAGADNVEVVIISNTTGLSDDARYDALADTYDALMNTTVDIVVPVGAYIDSPLTGSNRNFGYQLADFCYQATINNNTTIGVVGATAPTAAAATTGDVSLADMETWVAALETYDTSALQGTSFTTYDGVTDADADGSPENYGFVATSDRAMASSPTDGDVVKDAGQNFVDIGAYLSVVAGWGRFSGGIAQRLYPVVQYYNNSLASAYAGRIATLDSWNAPTNKTLRNVTPIRELSLSQHNRLAGQRFVTMGTKVGGFKVISAMTGAHRISQYIRSDYTRLSTVRIVHDTLNFVRTVAEPFIGRGNNAAIRGALETAVESALQKLRSLGALEDFQFSLTSTPSQRVLGEMTIDLTLVPAFEIRTINVKVALTPAAR